MLTRVAVEVLWPKTQLSATWTWSHEKRCIFFVFFILLPPSVIVPSFLHLNLYVSFRNFYGFWFTWRFISWWWIRWIECLITNSWKTCLHRHIHTQIYIFNYLERCALCELLRVCYVVLHVEVTLFCNAHFLSFCCCCCSDFIPAFLSIFVSFILISHTLMTVSAWIAAQLRQWKHIFNKNMNCVECIA